MLRKPKWVSIIDRLPSEDGKYIVCTVWHWCDETQDEYKPAVYTAGVHAFEANNVTHWLDWDLPEPPADWWEVFKKLNYSEFPNS